MNKMEKKDSCESARVHSMLRFSITNPTNYDSIYLEYLEMFLLRHTQEMQYLLGPASADYIFYSMTCL